MTCDVTPMVQLLTPEGRRITSEQFPADFDAETLLGFLRDMTLARRFDTEATALQRKGELGLWPPSLGQEAAQVGSARALGDRDVVFPAYREHAVAHCMGVDMRQLLALFRGSDAGRWDLSSRFRPYCMVIGTQTLHATGYAMGMAMRQEETAVIAYHGDGATAQGDVNEAYVFAASYQAPVVFFCQNNQWAISEPSAVQSRVPLYRRADGFGFPGIRVDGNDVLAVHAVTSWALDRARRGDGPALIEAFTYRMGPHTTADDPTRYRSREEADSWRLKDPITRLEAYLRGEGIVDDATMAELAAQADAYGAQIRSWIPSLQDITMDDAFVSVYAEPTEELEWQRHTYAGFTAGFEDLA